MPHFLADPEVGLVGAFTLPKEPYTTWIDRLRMFELIVSFGFVRPDDRPGRRRVLHPRNLHGFPATGGFGGRWLH